MPGVVSLPLGSPQFWLPWWCRTLADRGALNRGRRPNPSAVQFLALARPRQPAGALGALALDVDAAHEREPDDAQPRGAGNPGAAGVVVEAAHEPEAGDVHLDVLADGDLHPTHQRVRLDRHLALAEPRLAQVELDAAHQREGDERTRDDPPPRAPGAAHDRDRHAASWLAAEPLGREPAGSRHGRRGQALGRKIVGDLLEVGV